MSKMDLSPQPGETFPAFKQAQATPGKTPVLYGVFQVQRMTSRKKLVVWSLVALSIPPHPVLLHPHTTPHPTQARRVMVTNKSLVLATVDNKLVTRLPFIVDIDSAFFRPPDTVCLTVCTRAHLCPQGVHRLLPTVQEPRTRANDDPEGGQNDGGGQVPGWGMQPPDRLYLTCALFVQHTTHTQPAERFLRVLNFVRLKYADAEGQDIPCQRVSAQDDLTGHGPLDKKKIAGYKGPRSKMDDLSTRGKPSYLKLAPPPAPPEPEPEPEPELEPPLVFKPEPELPPPVPAAPARAVPEEPSEESSEHQPPPSRRRRAPRPPPSDYDDDEDLDPGLAPLAEHAPYPVRIPHMSALPPFASESPPPQPLRSASTAEPKAYPRIRAENPKVEPTDGDPPSVHLHLFMQRDAASPHLHPGLEIDDDLPAAHQGIRHLRVRESIEPQHPTANPLAAALYPPSAAPPAPAPLPAAAPAYRGAPAPGHQPRPSLAALPPPSPTQTWMRGAGDRAGDDDFEKFYEPSRSPESSDADKRVSFHHLGPLPPQQQQPPPTSGTADFQEGFQRGLEARSPGTGGAASPGRVVTSDIVGEWERAEPATDSHRRSSRRRSDRDRDRDRDRERHRRRADSRRRRDSGKRRRDARESDAEDDASGGHSSEEALLSPRAEARERALMAKLQKMQAKEERLKGQLRRQHDNAEEDARQRDTDQAFLQSIRRGMEADAQATQAATAGAGGADPAGSTVGDIHWVPSPQAARADTKGRFWQSFVSEWNDQSARDPVPAERIRV